MDKEKNEITLHRNDKDIVFSLIFGLFKQTIQFLQQIIVKKCHDHPAWIRTHDLFHMSRPP